MSFFFTKKVKIKKNNKGNVPWVEKYRPSKLDDVYSQNNIISTFRGWIDSDVFPHLLLYGPPGTGKTSTMMAICKELYSPNIFKQRVLELNASDERGINVVREKIKNFARFSAKTITEENYKNPPFKIIILDEADNMTADAQTALRRTIEDYSKVTRFCIICNYASKVIDPIVSRCALFRFSPITNDIMKTVLNKVCRKENILINENCITRIIKISGGDLRKAINFLQSIYTFYGSGGELDININLDKINELSGHVPSKIIINLNECVNFDQLRNSLLKTLEDGYDAIQLLKKTAIYITKNDSIDDTIKCKILLKIGNTENLLKCGSDEFLCLLDVYSYNLSLIQNS